MVKKLILYLVMLFFLIQIVSAIETEIKIKTMPNHEVQLTTSKANTASFSVIESFKNDSDEYGDVTFTSSTNEPKFNIIVFIKKDNVKIMGPEKFLDNPIGEPLYFEIAPDWFELIETPVNETNVSENLTIENISNDTEDEAENKSKITGSTILGEERFLSKQRIYYIVGGIFILITGFIILMIVKKGTKKRLFKGENAKQILGDISQEQEKNNKKELLEDAERKLRELEGDIRKLK